MMGVGSVVVARSGNHRAGGGANPTPALSDLRVVTIGIKAASKLVQKTITFTPCREEHK